MPAVDLHCHLLPGVDDGPDVVEESLEYARAVAAQGTATVVATPHVELVDVAELPDRVAQLREALARAGIALEVEVGGELKPESVGVLSGAELELIAHGPPGARWLLYEVPFRGVDEEFLEGARELRERGFGLLLAHPERSRGLLAHGLAALEPELARGSRLAANTAPLGGLEGPDRLAAAEHLLRAGLVDVVATDAHPPRRPFTLAQAGEVLARAGRPELVAPLTAQRPGRLLRAGLAVA